jgi:hypothetical protein
MLTSCAHRAVFQQCCIGTCPNWVCEADTAEPCCAMCLEANWVFCKGCVAADGQSLASTPNAVTDLDCTQNLGTHGCACVRANKRWYCVTQGRLHPLPEDKAPLASGKTDIVWCVCAARREVPGGPIAWVQCHDCKGWGHICCYSASSFRCNPFLCFVCSEHKQAVQNSSVMKQSVFDTILPMLPPRMKPPPSEQYTTPLYVAHLLGTLLVAPLGRCVDLGSGEGMANFQLHVQQLQLP